MIVAALVLQCVLHVEGAVVQDAITSQPRTGFGRSEVRYGQFDWWMLKGQHLKLYHDARNESLAERALEYLEDGYERLQTLFHHELSSPLPIVIFPAPYQFQQANLYLGLLSPGVAGFAEPLGHRAVIPRNGDLDQFRAVFRYVRLGGRPVLGLRLVGLSSRAPDAVFSGETGSLSAAVGVGFVLHFVLPPQHRVR